MARWVISISLVVVCVAANAAHGQQCDPQMGARQAAAFSGNLSLLYQIDAQYQACLRGQGQRQNYYAPPPPPPPIRPQEDWRNNPVVKAFDSLGEKIMSGQPLRQDIPLSAGVQQMETAAAPPPVAPNGYKDPFAPPASVAPTIPAQPSAPQKQFGSIWDPNQQAQITPGTPPGTANGSTSPQQNNNWEFVNPKGCTFDSPSCR